MFPNTIADPTLKPSRKDRRSQCARSVRLILHIFSRLNMKDYVEGQMKNTWRKTQVETSQYSARPQRRKGRYYYIEDNHKSTSR
jgi:hypothetical protein